MGRKESGLKSAYYSSIGATTYTRCYNNYTTSDTNTTRKVTVSGGVNSGHYNDGYGRLALQGVECQVGHAAAGGVAISYSSATGRMNYETWVATISKTYSFPRQHSDYTVQVWTKYWGSTLGNTAGAIIQSDSLYQTVTIPKRPSYTVKYNANGGTDAPSSQTKWYDESLTLAMATPNRTGYSFLGWATKADGAVTYSKGQTYTGNSGIELYAVWKANTYIVSYDANGGEGAPNNQSKIYGETLTLSSVVPTRTNYNFLGWGLSAESTTVTYLAGGAYSSNSAVVLYAVWELAWVAPVISNLVADRCTSDGTISDEGTNVKVTFNWKIDQLYELSQIMISYSNPDSSEYTDVEVPASGKSGAVEQIIGNNSLSTENSYSIKIQVADENGSSTSYSTIAPIAYTIDFMSGGNGVAFGKPATIDNAIETNFNLIANGRLVTNDRHIAYGPTDSYNDFTFYAADGYSNLNFDDDEPSRSQEMKIFTAYDLSRFKLGFFRFLRSTDKSVMAQLSLRNPISSRGGSNYFAIGIDGTGLPAYKIGAPHAFRTALGVGALLWSGTLSSGGSITVSDLPNYNMLGAITANASGTVNAERLLGVKNPHTNSISLFAAISFGSTFWITASTFSFDGTTLKFSHSNSQQFKGSLGSFQNDVIVIKEIYGLI